MKYHLSQVARRVIPIEVLLNDRATPKPVPTPEVGIRWGKPAQLRAERGGRDAPEVRKNGLKITFYRPEKVVHTVNILALTELYKETKAGEIQLDGLPEEDTANLEDTMLWIIKDGSYQIQDPERMKRIERTVEVYWEFALNPVGQIVFDKVVEEKKPYGEHPTK